MAARPSVILTRPLPEAQHWQRLLQAQGMDAAVLPLIDIAPATDAATQAALQGVAQQLERYRALMFVSPNAVRGLLAAPGMAQALQQAVAAGQLRLWAPGPGTRQTLVQQGLPETAIDSPAADAAQFDSESLWAVVGPQIQAHDQVLIVRGASAHSQADVQGSGREWLARQLRQQGAQVELVGVYARQCPAATPALLDAIASHCNTHNLWLFSSSEAVVHLQQLCPAQDWKTQRALATHPRIAATARAAGFGLVRECKPDVEHVSASIESWS
ncbi:uroporphyrinogen-III synthase [Comamonas sp. GB3 AK4-5]|uniref:uroporphyrinogen-III synthase n=1 Tax=Comamonas sp. GB3 AK4-5 TaxID=3231487 RepID=UPI00351DFA7C